MRRKNDSYDFHRRRRRRVVHNAKGVLWKRDARVNTLLWVSVAFVGFGQTCKSCKSKRLVCVT